MPDGEYNVLNRYKEYTVLCRRREYNASAGTRKARC